MAKVLKYRKAYEERERVQLDASEPVITEQHHAQEVTNQAIIAKYVKTGIVNHVAAATAEYGDFTSENEYDQALNLVLKAKENFDQLPSEVRQKFDNNPGKFFEFATDPKNQDEMVDMGLATYTPEEVQRRINELNKKAEEPAKEA